MPKLLIQNFKYKIMNLKNIEDGKFYLIIMKKTYSVTCNPEIIYGFTLFNRIIRTQTLSEKDLMTGSEFETALPLENQNDCLWRLRPLGILSIKQIFPKTKKLQNWSHTLLSKRKARLKAYCACSGNTFGLTPPHLNI